MARTHELKNGGTITALRRPPNNDSFTFNLFTELLETLECEFEAYYTWSNPPPELEKFLKTAKFTKPNVIIGIKDNLDMWTEFNYWTDKTVPGVTLLDSVAMSWPDTNFVVFTSLENIANETWVSPNLQFVEWSGDLSNQAKEYSQLVPVLEKNFDSTTPFVSLNRNRRCHRMVTLSYLFGKGYQQYGHITYLSQRSDTKKIDNLLDTMPWEFSEHHDEAREAMLSGYQQVYNNMDLCLNDYNIYRAVNDNVTNFNRNLRSIYQNSFVEIVSETSFAAPSFLVTEKTANSIYGCNFPIVLSGIGAVAHLRDIGFDVFDDVVDHSYDTCPDPFDRIITAIDRNHRLLTDVSYVTNIWRENTARFQKNIDIANDHMFPWYHARSTQQFFKIVWK